MKRICTAFWAAAAALGWMGDVAVHAQGHYALAFWRAVGAYENHAVQAGTGMQSAFVHVWDDQGQPLAGKQIFTSWGVLLGATDANGFTEIVLYWPNGYDFQVHDGAHGTDTTPVFNVDRQPSPGHYSFEVGFMFKRDAGSPGVFDQDYLGTVNDSGPSVCADLTAPHTRSLAYYSTAASNYCSDEYLLGTWTAAHGQTFVATGNRVVALKAFMAAGYGAHFLWTAQLYEGGPNGTPIGPPRTTRVLVDGEDFPVIVSWGMNDAQVVPGRTYYFRITRSGGVNVYRVNHNNYPFGNYFENDAPAPGSELMGLVVCADYTNSGPTGTLTGSVLDAQSRPLAGALVSLPDAALYTTTDTDGAYAIPFVPARTYDVNAAKPGYVTGLNTGVVVRDGLASESSFKLALQPTNTDSGIIASAVYNLQPFEVAPTWGSQFDATWGSAATFGLADSGQTGNALQISRSGPGSSARALVFTVKPNTPYQVSIWGRSPSSSSAYWAECAFKLGNATAQSFDQDPGSWTMIKKFDSSADGNNSTWTRYTANFNSGASSQVSVGFKLGASAGTGPALQWDQLAIVSLAPPSPTIAVAETPSSIVLSFSEALDETAATNALNYRVSAGNTPLALSYVFLANPTNVVLITASQPANTDYTLTVSNVIMAVQPASVSGRNGQLAVRVPFTLLPLDDTASWKYEASGANLGTAWRAPGFADAAWPEGPPLLGYSEGALPAPIRTALAPVANRITVYFRKRFVPWPALTNGLTPVRLSAVIDDGAVFWLNGVELGRLGMPAGSPGYRTGANRTVGVAGLEGPFNYPGATLRPGTNLLAVEVHQVDAASPDLAFGAELQALVLPSQTPLLNSRLTFARSGNLLQLNWTDPSRVLEAATNLTGPWVTWPQVGSAAYIQATNEVMFFRLKF